MRESLLSSFDAIWIDNLNGDKYRTGKVIPKGLPGEGTADQSVFTTEQDPRGIQVGVAITTLVKRGDGEKGGSIAAVSYRDFWGLSHAKRQALLSALAVEDWPAEKLMQSVARPGETRKYEVVVPTEKNDWKLLPRNVSGGFEDWPDLAELFPVNFHGVNTNRGITGSLIEMQKQALVERMSDYFSSVPWAEFSRRHPGLATPRARYKPEKVRDRLCRTSRYEEAKIKPYVQFPLDLRWIYYETEEKLISEHGPEFARNLDANEFLVTVPEPRKASETRPMLLTSLFGLHVHDRGAVTFPSHVRREVAPRNLFSTGSPDGVEPEANLAESVWITLARTWSLCGDLAGDSAKDLVHRLFHLTLALAHAPQYEADHKESLAQDWIHLPIPKDAEVLARAASLGETVGILLNPLSDATNALRMLLGSSRRSLAVGGKRGGGAVKDSELVVTFSYYGGAQGGWRERAPRPDEASRPEWGEQTGDLYLNEDVFLSNVPERVWRYELGGYPVIKKWLGYRDAGRRPGQPLSLAEHEHLRSMVHRIAALLLLHDALDRAYEQVIEDPFTAEDLGLR